MSDSQTPSAAARVEDQVEPKGVTEQQEQPRQIWFKALVQDSRVEMEGEVAALTSWSKAFSTALAGPEDWLTSQGLIAERDHLENVMNQRVQFFFTVFALTVAAVSQAETTFWLVAFLLLGLSACYALARAIHRSDMKLDVVLKELYRRRDNVVWWTDEKARQSKVWHQPDSVRRLLVVTPYIACALLLGAAFFAWLGWLDPPKSPKPAAPVLSWAITKRI